MTKKHLPSGEEWRLAHGVDVPSQAALEAMSEEQLLGIAKKHHGEAKAIFDRDILPHGVVAGLALDVAKAKIQKGGTSWTRWLQSEWPEISVWTADQYIRTAKSFRAFVASSNKGPQAVMATMAQATKVIGFAELAKPRAREVQAAEPQDAEFDVATPVAPARSNVHVPAPAPVIDRDELDHLDAEEQAEQEALDAAGIYAGQFAPPADPPAPAPESEPEPQPDVILQELLLRLEECPTDTRTIRLVLWGQADLPAMRGALAHGLSLEQLALEAVDAVWRQLEQCLAAPRPANTSPLEWLAPSTKKALTAVRDALSPVVDLAAQAVTDKHGDGGVARARRERREIEERQRARRAAEGAAS